MISKALFTSSTTETETDTQITIQKAKCEEQKKRREFNPSKKFDSGPASLCFEKVSRTLPT